MSEQKIEIQDGNRFKFGSNWSNFIRLLNNDRILKAEKSLINALGVDNLENNAVNHAASRSRVLDADYAAETTELARTQIIQQAGTAMLAQANQKSQSVLQLLKG